MEYTESFRAQMIRRMIGPPSRSGNSLAREVGVSQATLCRWRKEAVDAVGMASPKDPPPQGAGEWSAEQKFKLLVEAEGLEDEALGALLRRVGLHEGQLRSWREAAAGALNSEVGSAAAKQEDRRIAGEANKRIKALEQELLRKERALAEAAALLILEKKLQGLGWGGEGIDTKERNEK